MLLAGALSHPCVIFYRFLLVLIERRRMLPNNHIFFFLLSEASLINLGDRNLCNFNKYSPSTRKKCCVENLRSVLFRPDLHVALNKMKPIISSKVIVIIKLNTSLASQVNILFHLHENVQSGCLSKRSSFSISLNSVG